MGAALGVAAAPALAWMMAVSTGPTDLFGLSITCAVFMSLFVSFLGRWIGMGIHRRGVDMPAMDATDSAFMLAVSAGEGRDRAQEILHRFGGHEPMPGAAHAAM